MKQVERTLLTNKCDTHHTLAVDAVPSDALQLVVEGVVGSGADDAMGHDVHSLAGQFPVRPMTPHRAGFDVCKQIPNSPYQHVFR